jgi:hypothetical protein
MGKKKGAVPIRLPLINGSKEEEEKATSTHCALRYEEYNIKFVFKKIIEKIYSETPYSILIFPVRIYTIGNKLIYKP